MNQQSNPVSAFASGLMPSEKITVSEWADRYRRLASSSSAEPGQYRTSRTPYMKAIMDALSVVSSYSEIVFMKSAQVGSSEAGFNWIGYIMDVEPASTLLVMPTESMYKIMSKTRIDPMIQATPTLYEKFKKGSNGRDSGNTIDYKEFPGGFLRITNAGSPSALASMPIKNVMLDEVDRYPSDVKGEGSPIDLAKARTRTFPNRKIFIGSTPTIKDQSVVEREFMNSDQNYFEVPCPSCSCFQRLEFEQLKYTDKNPETTVYECIHCGEHIKERFKTRMMANGQWKPYRPELSSGTRIGFHINALYAPLGMFSWKEIVKEWLASQGNDPKMKAFMNTILGLTWEESGEAPSWTEVYNKREDYDFREIISNDIGMITSGVDVQKDRLELEIVGWCRNNESYSLDYLVLEGDTTKQKVWDDLAAVLARTFQKENGSIMPVNCMAVDTGYNTQHAYAFCRKYPINKVIAIKGAKPGQVLPVSVPRKVDVNMSGKQMGSLFLYHVAGDHFKSEFYGNLRGQITEEDGIPIGYCHFPMLYGEEHFRSLTAEVMRPVNNKGNYVKYEWVKVYDRNERLDTRVYARAAAYHMQIDRWSAMDWTRVTNSVVRKDTSGSGTPVVEKATEGKTVRTPPKTSYWGRYRK